MQIVSLLHQASEIVYPEELLSLLYTLFTVAISTRKNKFRLVDIRAILYFSSNWSNLATSPIMQLWYSKHFSLNPSLMFPFTLVISFENKFLPTRQKIEGQPFYRLQFYIRFQKKLL